MLQITFCVPNDRIVALLNVAADHKLEAKKIALDKIKATGFLEDLLAYFNYIGSQRIFPNKIENRKPLLSLQIGPEEDTIRLNGDIISEENIGERLRYLLQSSPRAATILAMGTGAMSDRGEGFQMWETEIMIMWLEKLSQRWNSCDLLLLHKDQMTKQTRDELEAESLLCHAEYRNFLATHASGYEPKNISALLIEMKAEIAQPQG